MENSRQVARGLRCCAVSAALSLATALASAQQAAVPPPSTLKKMSVEQLMDIVVTSVSKHPEKLSDVASAIQVVTGDDVRRAGATSIPEALRLASNLEVAQIDSRQWAISARGFNNLFADKMLVLMDGRTVYTPLYAGVYWDVQDTMLEDLDRVEVISGPGATQWGANAVNGVINITTKSAKDTQGGLVATGFGSELRTSDEVRYGGQIAPNVYYRVYAKYFDRDDSVRPDDRVSGDAWHVSQTGFRTDWEPGHGNTFTFQGDAYTGLMGQLNADSIGASGGNLLGRWSRTFDDDSNFKLQAYYDRTHRNIPGSFTQDLDTYDIDFQHSLHLTSVQAFVWGLEYRLVADDILNTPANAFLPPRINHEWASGFVQDEIALSKDLHFTVGTKLEHNDYTGFEFQPSVRLAWRPGNDQTLWTAVSRAVRTPSRIDRDLYSPAEPPYRQAGSPNVVSEKLIAYEVGYRAQLDPRLAVSISTFYNDYNDLRSLEPLNPPFAFPAATSSGLEGDSYGAELTADWRVSPDWRLRAGWTELRVHSSPQAGSPDRATRDSIVRDPDHSGSLHSLFDFATHWEFDAGLRYVSAIDNQSVPGYTELDLRLGWQPVANWEFSLSGQNLLHPKHVEFDSPATRRDLQRSVFAKATWRF